MRQEDHHTAVVPFMPWDDRYATEITTIDKQHQAIVALINEVHHAMVMNEPAVIVEGIIRKLLAYAEEHFDYEEQCMELCAFAQITAHRCRHKEMLGVVRQFEAAILANDTAVYSGLLEFLMNWLRGHILVEDRRYIPDMQKAGLSGPAAIGSILDTPLPSMHAKG